MNATCHAAEPIPLAYDDPITQHNVRAETLFSAFNGIFMGLAIFAAPIVAVTSLDATPLELTILASAFPVGAFLGPLWAMLGRRWGRVIAITSVSGIIGQLGQTHYSSAKAGMAAFIKALARETASYGVTANAIAPGFIDTDLLQAMPKAKLEEYLADIPLRRLGKPEEVAELVAYLASDAAGYVTGQTIRIDGGLVMS